MKRDSLVLLIPVIIMIGGCGVPFGRAALMTGFSMGGAWPHKNAYKDPPQVDENDFWPSAPKPFVEHTTSKGTGELALSAQFRYLVLDYLYLGLETIPVALFGNANSSCGGVNCQPLRLTTVEWWNEVTAADVVLRRKPSLGVFVGLISGDSPVSPIIQYSISARSYKLDVSAFEGIDCVGCRNTSKVRSSQTVMSGVAVRHTIEFGMEMMRLYLWFEHYDSDGWTGGLGVNLVGFMLRKEEEKMP